MSKDSQGKPTTSQKAPTWHVYCSDKSAKQCSEPDYREIVNDLVRHGACPLERAVTCLFFPWEKSLLSLGPQDVLFPSMLDDNCQKLRALHQQGKMDIGLTENDYVDPWKLLKAVAEWEREGLSPIVNLCEDECRRIVLEGWTPKAVPDNRAKKPDVTPPLRPPMKRGPQSTKHEKSVMKNVYNIRRQSQPYSEIARILSEDLEQSRRDWMKRKKTPLNPDYEFSSKELIDEAKRLYDARRKQVERGNTRPDK